MSPFHDLGRRCGSPFPVENARSLRSSGLAPAAGGRRGAKNTELQASLFRVSKVDGRKLTGASRHAETSYSRALYTPPNHRDGAAHHTRADEEADDERFDGPMTE